ncbi:MAG: ABC transporter ATP-binding protein [Hyphomonadaceae bacterium]|nr:ABC transporter ATP-binding protein [Hyphomonadaceae bacterium]MBC6411618.1 ABC transporter ATP-binding protein [Hyphomonadaceae bacterium]
MLLLAAATAAYTFVVKTIVDTAAALDTEANPAHNNARHYAIAILPLLLGITLASGLSNYFQRILTNVIALNAVGEMQKQMFASSQTSDYASFAREPIGERISKFTHDVTVVSNTLIRVLSNLVKDVLTVVFTIAAMLWQNWMLSLVMTVFILAFVPIVRISRRMRGSARDVQEHIGVITSELKESFSGVRMVKTYGLETRESERLDRSFDLRISKFLKLVSQQACVDPILEVLGGLAIVGVVIFGVYQVSAGLATPGSIVGVLTGLLILSPRLRALGTLNNAAQEGLSSLTRIFDVIDEKSAIIDAPDAKPLIDPRGIVELENVSFTYMDGTQALSDVSISATDGENIALVGLSGSGKSTIINLIPRLYDVDSGTIKIDGRDIRDVTLASLRKSISLVSQDVTVFNNSVAANIGFGDLSASRDDIVAAAKAADAHDFIQTLPEGYDTIVGEDGDTLSGGQKQRIAIARAILRDAPILLLDEATSALDAESESNVQAALERLSNGRTTITIAHRLSTVQNADRIYVMDKGRVVETGTHKALSKKRGGLYARLRDLQLS